MDPKLAEYLACFFNAEQALLAEYAYFRSRAEDPFLTGADRSLAVATLVQLNSCLTALRLQQDAVVSKYRPGVAPPSATTVAQAVAATKRVAAKLAEATKAVAVLESASEFLNVLVKLEAPPVQA
jgi:hypothetical protein